jgi:hypothetical protein
VLRHFSRPRKRSRTSAVVRNGASADVLGQSEKVTVGHCLNFVVGAREYRQGGNRRQDSS